VAGVIKAEQSPRLGRSHGGFSLSDFAEEGRQLLEAVRARAEKMTAEAEAEAKRLQQEARGHGYEVGYQEGLAEGRAAGHAEAMEKASAEFEARLVQLASACESLFREVDRRKAEQLLAGHRDLVVLALAIAERVVRRIGLIDRQAAVENLRAVIDLVGQTSDMVVEVNPVDAETLERFAPELMARRSDLKHVEVRSNEAVNPGGCVVTTRGGQIDATLETQLTRIAQELVPGLATPGEEQGPGDAGQAEPDS